MRSFVVDGNFTADHIKQARPNDDVWLTDGEGMMTERASYAAHIKAAKDTKEVSFFCVMLSGQCLIIWLDRSLSLFGKQLPGHPRCKHRIGNQRRHWHCNTCLCTPRLLLPIKWSQFLEGWTTEMHRLFTIGNMENHQLSWNRPVAGNIWHYVSILQADAEAFFRWQKIYFPAPDRVWKGYRHVSCPWPQRYLFLPICI